MKKLVLFQLSQKNGMQNFDFVFELKELMKKEMKKKNFVKKISSFQLEEEEVEVECLS